MQLTIADISTSIDAATFSSTVAGIGLQVSRDFQSEWNTNATLAATQLDLTGTQVSLNTATDAVIYVGDSSADPTTGVGGAFGYHSDNYGHIPYGFVYLDVCSQYGEAWSCTLSHEVLELLADPTAVLTVTGPDPQLPGGSVYYDLEVCDPTQGDTYLVNGIKVSNFVNKAWFQMVGGSSSTNFLNLTLSPFKVRPGGYCQYEDSAGSHQINGSKVDAQRLNARKILGSWRRNARRAGRLGRHQAI
jgi:hypothetical protein